MADLAKVLPVDSSRTVVASHIDVKTVGQVGRMLIDEEVARMMPCIGETMVTQRSDWMMFRWRDCDPIERERF